MKATNIECDMCGSTLVGRKGREYIQKEHIAFRGSMTIQTYNQEETDHYFITRNQTDDHHFCNFDCLNDFAEMRRDEYDRIIKDRLRRETDTKYFDNNRV